VSRAAQAQGHAAVSATGPDVADVRARYFCAGMLDIAKYSHWALNTPLYTHFTVSRWK
jgi:exoribonuclease R